jgi:hypothetical protein
MTLSPRERLAQALQNVTDIARCAHRAGVTPREFANAQVKRPCPTIPFLRICVAIGHDPLPELPHKMPEKPSDFDFGFFSMAFRMKRAMLGLTEIGAGHALLVLPATIRRIERGDKLQISVVLRACVMIGVHPFGYLAVTDTPVSFFKNSRVSRETSARSVADA